MDKVRLILGSLVGAALIQFVSAACTTKTTDTSNANADPAASGADFEVAEEPCDKSYAVTEPPFAHTDGGTRTVIYAEHAYPGKTKLEIAAHVKHWIKVTPEMQRPPGYEINLQTAVYARDGFAGAGCNQGETSYFIYR